MRNRTALIVSLFAALLGFQTVEADTPSTKPKPAPKGPWLTGPLLAPSGHVIPYGHINYEPYWYWSQVRGVYDAHWKSHRSAHIFTQVLNQPTFQCGILPATEFDFAPQIYYQHFDGQADWVLGDMPISLSFPLLNDRPGKWWPAIKLKINANLPFGKYQRLDPRKLGTDLGGSGSFSPGVGVVLSRLFHFWGVHYLATRWYFSYAMPTPVHVTGLNNYGGAQNTRGKVYPGQTFFTDFAFEFCLTQRWALSFDATWQHTNRARFKGNRGTVRGRPAPLGNPSLEQFTIATGLEYNWNEWLGAIAGPWFTVGGRNSSKFLQWVFAINIYV